MAIHGDARIIPAHIGTIHGCPRSTRGYPQMIYELILGDIHRYSMHRLWTSMDPLWESRDNPWISMSELSRNRSNCLVHPFGLRSGDKSCSLACSLQRQLGDPNNLQYCLCHRGLCCHCTSGLHQNTDHEFSSSAWIFLQWAARLRAATRAD